jgi:hypothetical protein
MAKKIEDLDKKIEIFGEKNKEIDNEIMMLTQKLVE